jgi:hypothetical protein
VLDRSLGSLTMRLGVLCDHAMVGQDGKLSVIGIFDHIGVLQLPAQHPRFFVVAVLQGDAPSDQIELELAAPDGKSLMRESIGIDPEAIAQGSGNLIAEVTMLPLEQSGRYEFRMNSQGRALGIIPLTVDTVEMNQPPQLHAVPRA